MDAQLLRIDDLTVHYGRLEALHGISLKVGKGEIVAILGQNGAGKSTTLKAIAGLKRPTHGDIAYQSKSLRGVSQERITRLGLSYVPEGRHSFATLTVRENLRLATTALPRGRKPQLDRVLTLFPILDRYMDLRATDLSGGEQQMLGIARALLAEPTLLLLDEPSLGLAPKIAQSVLDTVAKLRDEDGVTVLVVEQNATRVLDIADRAYVLRSGVIVEEGTPEEIRGELTRAYFGGTSS